MKVLSKYVGCVLNKIKSEYRIPFTLYTCVVPQCFLMIKRCFFYILFFFSLLILLCWLADWLAEIFIQVSRFHHGFTQLNHSVKVNFGVFQLTFKDSYIVFVFIWRVYIIKVCVWLTPKCPKWFIVFHFFLIHYNSSFSLFLSYNLHTHTHTHMYEFTLTPVSISRPKSLLANLIFKALCVSLNNLSTKPLDRIIYYVMNNKCGKANSKQQTRWTTCILSGKKAMNVVVVKMKRKRKRNKLRERKRKRGNKKEEIFHPSAMVRQFLKQKIFFLFRIFNVFKCLAAGFSVLDGCFGMHM